MDSHEQLALAAKVVVATTSKELDLIEKKNL